MTHWEYAKIDLSNVAPPTSDIDVLNDAGSKGWELVSITPLNCAVLKRPVATKSRQTKT